MHYKLDEIPLLTPEDMSGGYVFSGCIRARYQDGSEEVVGPGEIYWIRKGHVLIYEEATHHLEINPHRELRMLMGTLLESAARRAAAGSSSR